MVNTCTRELISLRSSRRPRPSGSGPIAVVRVSDGDREPLVAELPIARRSIRLWWCRQPSCPRARRAFASACHGERSFATPHAVDFCAGAGLLPNQENYVSAAQLAQTAYLSGSGADMLWVRVSDGDAWSPWSQSFTVTAPVDTGPVAVPVRTDVSAAHGQSFAASSLFTASDPFGDAITQYDFWNSGSGGGHFLLDNQALGASAENFISAAQLAQTTYQSGSGADTLWVRVSDG